jgi:hypothetical protein
MQQPYHLFLIALLVLGAVWTVTFALTPFF